MAIEPYGLIGAKWHEFGGLNGTLGAPQEAERGYPQPGQVRPRIQHFARGTIAWCPDQGPFMMVSGWRDASNRASFFWGPTSPFDYGRFIVRWHISPDPEWHQADVNGLSRTVGGFGPVGWPTPGYEDVGTTHAHIEFIVEGYDGNSRQGWTIPIDFDLF